MADDLPVTGARLEAQDADPFLQKIADTKKAIDDLGTSVTKLGKADGNLDKTSKGVKDVGVSAQDAKTAVNNLFDALRLIPGVGNEIQGVIGSLQTLGSVGNSAGTVIQAGMGGATLALGALVVGIGAAIAAFGALAAAASSAISTALNFGAAVNSIQVATGATSDLAQEFYLAGQASGVSVNNIASSFRTLDNKLIGFTEGTDRAMSRAGGSVDKLGDHVDRLGEDHISRIADIYQAQADRIADINDRLVDAQANLNERLARLAEDYNRNIADGREALAQRLSDIEESHVQKVADIQQNITDVIAAANARRAEFEQKHADKVAEIQASIALLVQDTADKRTEIERDLATRIAELNARAQSDINKAIQHGGDDQIKLEQQLQSKIASITEKYANKRLSLQEKIADPTTNPILRKFYRNQLIALDKQEKAEKDAAKSDYQLKLDRLKAETAATIAEIKRRLEEQIRLEKQKVADDLARIKIEYERRLAALQAQLIKENAEYAKQSQELNADRDKRLADLQKQLSREYAEYAKQTDKLRAENARREADAKRSYDRSVNDAQQAFDKQVAASAVAQAKILAETNKRLAAEQKSYDRALADAEAALTKFAGGGGGGGLGPIAPAAARAAAALRELGIDVATFAKLPFPEQLEAIRKGLENIKDPAERARIIRDILGPEGAADLDNYTRALDRLKKVGLKLLTPEELQLIRDANTDIGALKAQFELLGAKIGVALLPVLVKLLDKLQELWDKHGPEITAAIEKIVNDAMPGLIGAIEHSDQTFKDINTTIGDVSRVFTDLDTLFNDVHNAINQNAIDTRQAFEDFVYNMNKAGRDLKEGITNSVTELGANISDKAESIKNTLTTAWTDITNDVQLKWEEIKSTIADKFQAAKDSIDGTLANIGPSLSSAWESIRSTAESAWNSIADAIKRPFESAFNWINDRINELKRTIAGIQLPSFGGGYSAPPGYFGYAAGGMMRSGQPALVGEHGPELIFPSRDYFVLTAPQTKAITTPATGAQMAAAKTTNFNNTRSNTAVTLNVTVNGGSSKGVSDGIYNALYRAGLVTVN